MSEGAAGQTPRVYNMGGHRYILPLNHQKALTEDILCLYGAAMTDETYTLNEVAVRLSLSKKDQAVALLTRKVKHWTNYDLLNTIGEKHTGTGRNRQYKRDEVFCAAYLNELSKFGLTIGGLKAFREEYDKWMKSPQKRKLLQGGVTEDEDNIHLGEIGGYILYQGWSGDDETNGKFLFVDDRFLQQKLLGQFPSDMKPQYFASILLLNCQEIVERLKL